MKIGPSARREPEPKRPAFKSVIEERGPVQYSGPQFENSWRVPEGARWVTIWTSGPTTFNVTFTKEEPK